MTKEEIAFVAGWCGCEKTLNDKIFALFIFVDWIEKEKPYLSGDLLAAMAKNALEGKHFKEGLVDE